MTKKSAFSSAFSGKVQQVLTPIQAEVLYYLTKEFLTPKQIATRRKTKIRTIQATIKKLKDFGLINNQYREVRFCAPTNALLGDYSDKNLIRLHGEEWNIIILYKDERYKETLNNSNFIDFDGNTVRLSRDSIEVYSGKSFYASEPSKATYKAFEYWNTFFNKLGSYLNILIIKPKVQNIKRVNAHYAEVNNELAKDYEEKGERIRVYTRDDGKLWFLIDNSFNLHEAETVHPNTSKGDMELVKEMFNDVRNNEWSDLKTIVRDMTMEYNTNLKLHLEVMQQMKDTLKKIEDKLK
jgi:hypothetical protein